MQGISRAAESKHQVSDSQSTNSGGGDSETQDEEEAGEIEGLVGRAVQQQKDAPQPANLRAPAQHRRQRLRELQDAQQLAAALGSSSGVAVAQSPEFQTDEPAPFWNAGKAKGPDSILHDQMHPAPGVQCKLCL